MKNHGEHPKNSQQPQWARALTVREAQRELGPLSSLSDVERWLDRIPLMARTGRLRSKQVTGSLLNAMHVWCSKHGREYSLETMRSIERRLTAIETTTRGTNRIIRHPTPPSLSSGHRRATTVREKRVRQRRRLANRRAGHECRSGADRRRARRRQRTSSGRRSGLERRRNADRRAGMDRRHRDRRGGS